MKGFSLALVFVVPLAGCESIPNSDRLAITFGSGELAPPVDVDTRCENGGCDGREELEASVYWDAAQGVDATTARVELLEYRVDLDLFGVEQEPPFYANVTSVFVPPYEATTFNVKAVGSAQRDYVRDLGLDAPLNGIGTLTLAGYDHRNEIVEVSVNFDITFYDFVDDETN